MERYPGYVLDDDDDDIYEQSKRDIDARFYNTFPAARVHHERLGVIKSHNPGVVEPTHIDQYLEELQIAARIHAPIPSTPLSPTDFSSYACSSSSHATHAEASSGQTYGPAASDCLAQYGEAEQTSSGYHPAPQFGDSQPVGYEQIGYAACDWYRDAARADQSVSAPAADYAHQEAVPRAHNTPADPQPYLEYLPTPPPITPATPMSTTARADPDEQPRQPRITQPSVPPINTSREAKTLDSPTSARQHRSPPRPYPSIPTTSPTEAAAAAAALAKGRRHHSMGNRRGRVALPPLEKVVTPGAEKPPLACLFCRGRKIACGAPAAGSNTCNQCARRGLSCVYPTENRRGTRARQPQRRSPQPRGKKHNAAPPAPGVDGMQIYDPESMWPSGDDDEDDDAHYAEPSSSSGIATSA
ncbi:hypothetical protein BD626DRAFT_476550 [Schizophyllum amplum]|uniref:Zn(2)-C6 fungal-type domain-containing protein n=1 Tax=Schizophyllum amplum TaxID=97359 RepID=A0A550CZF9_9AGAR|nr:hypothetical protein BD626DRAFT_476550 [Auriculariopsis ampla]